MAQSGTFALGTGYFFIVVDRAWLNGKYLRFRWTGTITTASCDVLIYDGAYDRSSDVDFPSGAPIATKGNGLLQTVISAAASFGWETRDLQTNLGAGSEEFCTVFFRARDHTSPGNVLLDLDWFEINSGAGGAGAFYDEQFTDAVTMERTGTFGDYGYISTGTAIPMDSIELGCGFEVGQGSEDLTASFTSSQWQEDLPAQFTVRQAASQDLGASFDGQAVQSLFAGFIVRPLVELDLAGSLVVRASTSTVLPAGFAVRRDTSGDLAASLEVNWIGDLKAGFRVEKIYDLRGTAGVAFYWWGANNPPEALNQLRLETPTGFWYSDFIDGPARLRHVFIPWGSFTWVSAEQRYLEPHRHGFNEPDKSQIDAILFTIHTTGVRRIDYIYAPLMNEFICKFIVRHSDALNLSAGFAVRRSNLDNMPGELVARHASSVEFGAGFRVGQEVLDLASAFRANIERLALPAKFSVLQSEIEDFEDATLVDHYQHYSGNGFRDGSFPHSGSYSWRTRAGQNDIFDISNGDTLAYAKVEVWARYGNGTRKIELLDSAFNTLAQTTWGFISGYHQKSVEYTGAVKYFRITCPAGGNSGLWTDDIEIKWA